QHTVLTNRPEHRLLLRLRMTTSAPDVIPADRHIKSRTFHAADATTQSLKLSIFQLIRFIGTRDDKRLHTTSHLINIQTAVPILLVRNFMDFAFNIVAHRHFDIHVIHNLHIVMLIDKNRSEEHTSELQSRFDLVCRLLLEKKKTSM